MNVNSLSEKELQTIVDHPVQYEEFIVDLAKKRLDVISHNDFGTQPPPQQWYYTWKGQRIGPVSETVVQQKIHEQSISDKTLMWTQGMTDWTPAVQTMFVSAIHPHIDPSVPPPLFSAAINNTYIWIIALAPIIGSIVGKLLFFGSLETYSGITAAVITLIAGFMEEVTLERAGHNSPIFIWIFLFIPVYFLLRARKLKQGYSFFFVWLGSMAFFAMSDLFYLQLLEILQR